MACGCPVISSSASSLPEVAGDAAILVDPQHPETFAQEIERVLNNPALWQELHSRGLRQAARFSWDRAARETVRVYQSVVLQQV
jgi:alpha-1,3-rhamnosyl/mannosyltransferase